MSHSEVTHLRETIASLEKHLAYQREVHMSLVRAIAAGGLTTHQPPPIVVPKEQTKQFAEALGEGRVRKAREALQPIKTMLPRMRKAAEQANPCNIVAVELAQIADYIAQVEEALS